MDEAAFDGTDPLDRIRRRGLAYLRWGVDNPEHYRILMMSRPGATPDRYLDQRLADTSGLEAVAADIADAAVVGLISMRRSPLEEAELFWMVIHGTVSMLIAKPDLAFAAPEEIYGAMFDLVYQGLAPRP